MLEEKKLTEQGLVLFTTLCQNLKDKIFMRFELWKC